MPAMQTTTAARIDRGLTVTVVVLAVVVAVVVAAFLSAGLGLGIGGPSDIERAAAKCDTGVGDGGESLHLTTIDDAVCVLAELDAPDSLVGKMSDTRAIDGRQEDSWSDYEASWTYHPDDGLRVVVEQKD